MAQESGSSINVMEVIPGQEPPWPSSMRKVATAVELPVPFLEFYATCWSDDARVSFTKAVHEERGDSEVHVTNWSGNRPAGFCRDLTFRCPIKGMSLGPKSTYCHQTQQIRRYAEDSFTIQTSQARAVASGVFYSRTLARLCLVVPLLPSPAPDTDGATHSWQTGPLSASAAVLSRHGSRLLQVMTEIPYGDYFRVEQRWDVKSLPGGRTLLTVGVDVPFSKSTFLKGTIESSTFSETSDVINKWIEARAPPAEFSGTPPREVIRVCASR